VEEKEICGICKGTTKVKAKPGDLMTWQSLRPGWVDKEEIKDLESLYSLFLITHPPLLSRIKSSEKQKKEDI